MANVPNGYVHLILCKLENDTSYLELPLSIITTLCIYPVKYLQYLGWCVLGVKGTVQDNNGLDVDLNSAQLIEQSTYHYILPSTVQDPLSHAVSPEAMSKHSSHRTQIEPRESFLSDLIDRDGHRRVWSGHTRPVGIRIVPYAKGEEWFQKIVENRLDQDEEGLENENMNLDDIRNGAVGNPNIQSLFDAREVAVLKTPNPILQREDVPDASNLDILALDETSHSFPPSSRYTLQYLIPSGFFFSPPNNSDAAFEDLDQPLPSSLLLHYNYGAAAVACWGKNSNILRDCPGFPRPTQAKLTNEDHQETIRKRERTSTSQAGTALKRARKEKGVSNTMKSDELGWDADELIMFFWSNTPAARARRARKEQEQKDAINSWRNGVPA